MKYLDKFFRSEICVRVLFILWCLFESRDAQAFQDKGPKTEKLQCRGPEQRVNVKTCYKSENNFYRSTHQLHLLL